MGFEIFVKSVHSSYYRGLLVTVLHEKHECWGERRKVVLAVWRSGLWLTPMLCLLGVLMASIVDVFSFGWDERVDTVRV